MFDVGKLAASCMSASLQMSAETDELELIYSSRIRDSLWRFQVKGLCSASQLKLHLISS